MYQMEKSDSLKKLQFLTSVLDKQGPYSKKSLQKLCDHPKKERIVIAQDIRSTKFKQDNTLRKVQIDHILPSSSSTVTNESRVIFVNPKKLQMSDKDLAEKNQRLVLPLCNLEKQKTLNRKVFINPNFKQPTGKHVSQAPLEGYSQASFTDNHKVCNVLKNITTTTTKSETKNTVNILNQQHEQVKNSCYVNPNFKGGIFSHKKIVPLQKNEKEPLKNCHNSQRRVVCNELTSNQTNKSVANKKTNVNINNQTSFASEEKKLPQQIFYRNEDLKNALLQKNNKEVKQQVKCDVLENTMNNQNRNKCEPTSLNTAVAAKIFVNKERLKLNLAKTASAQSLPQENKNIYVNKSLILTKASKSPPKVSTKFKTTPFNLQNKLNNINIHIHTQSTDMIKLSQASIVKKRKRSSSSSCLISLSKTKMVRRNKMKIDNLNLENKSTQLNKIRKLELTRAQRMPCIHSSRITKFRHQSFVRSVNNLVNFNNRKKNMKTDQSKYRLNRTKINMNPYTFNKHMLVNHEVNVKRMAKKNSSLVVLSSTKLIRRKLVVKNTKQSVQLARFVKSKYRYHNIKKHAKPGINCRRKVDGRVRKKLCTTKSPSTSLVNIGGVFYKATRNTLTRRSLPSRKNVSKGPIVHVRGERFQLDNTGHTLIRLNNNSATRTNKLQRVDIGGVTFVQSKGGTSLIRTNSHTARSRVIQAKQRSIMMLTKKLRKNNQPCPLFHRFGHCKGKELGTCSRLHDPNNVSVCKKFVQGCCENIECLLSHDIGPEKMPTCHHYLAGNCVRDNCPYLHVKVNSKAPVCPAFLQGYCKDGQNCNKRHVNVCPEYECKGTCVRRKHCPFPHPRKKPQPNPRPKPKRKKIEDKKPTAESEQVSACRYFDGQQSQDVCNESLQEEVDDGGENVFTKRPTLGTLPAFIPLNMN